MIKYPRIQQSTTYVKKKQKIQFMDGKGVGNTGNLYPLGIFWGWGDLSCMTGCFDHSFSSVIGNLWESLGGQH